MNTKLALGLIVLTAVGTYAVSHTRRHHFEPTKFGNGSILLDSETGVECSARFDMKWTNDDKKVVWAAGLAAQNAETAYANYIKSHHMDIFDVVAAINALGNAASQVQAAKLPAPEPVDATLQNLYSSMEDQDSTYNSLVKRADNEKIPDPDSSYFKNFPLCKDIR